MIREDKLTKLAKAVPGRLRPPLRWLWSSWHKRKLLRSAIPESGIRHGLPGELVVSLTSYPPRFPTLEFTLRSLLLQSVRPDRFILWIAHGDVLQLPKNVRSLAYFGLEIRECEDLRSYKKLVPALETFPEAFLVSADDDLYYPPHWLSILANGFDHTEQVITSRRAVRLTHLANGELAPFKNWEQDVQDAQARQPSTDLMPETGGGALFPPHSLAEVVTDRDLFERLAPTGDDLWFYWCARMAGTKVKKVGGSLVVTGWPGSNDSALWNENEFAGNDRMILALEKELGPPL